MEGMPRDEEILLPPRGSFSYAAGRAANAAAGSTTLPHERIPTPPRPDSNERRPLSASLLESGFQATMSQLSSGNCGLTGIVPAVVLESVSNDSVKTPKNMSCFPGLLMQTGGDSDHGVLSFFSL